MKFKNYTRAIVATMATMLVFAGCNNTNDPPAPSGGSFAISVNEITTNSATVMVVPTNMDMTYYVDVVETTKYTTDEALAAQNLADMKAKAEAASMTLEAYLAANLEKGTSETPCKLTTPGVGYYAYVYGLGTNGVATTTIDKKEFTAGGGDDAFAITVSNVTPSACTVNFVPKDEITGYFWNIESKETIDLFGGMEKFEDYFAEYTKVMCENNKCTPADLAKKFMSIGEDGDDLTGLDSGTDYYAFAFNIDDDFNKLGSVVFESFKTLDIQPSDLTFTFKIEDVKASSAHITITPSNNEDKFFCDIQKKSVCDAVGSDNGVRDELIDLYSSYGIMDLLLGTGVYEYLHEDFAGDGELDPGTEYYILAFGYDGGATTDLFKQAFKTEEATPPAGSFAIDVTPTDPYRTIIDVTPEDIESKYMWDVVSQAEFTAAGGTAAGCLQALYDMYKETNPTYTPAFLVTNLAEKGPSGYYYILDPSSDYYVWSAYVNPDGTISGETIVSDKFTTGPANPSSALVTVSCPKYYDGDALFAADPVKYANTKGKPYAPTTITPNADAAAWYIGLFGADYSTPALLSDAMVIKNIAKTKNTGTKTINYMAGWQQCTFLAVGANTEGTFGQIVRVGIKFEKSKISPISDLISPAAASRQAMLQTAEIMMPKLFNGKPLIAADREAMKTAPKVTILPTRAEKITNANTANARKHFDLKAPSKKGMKRNISIR